MIYFWYGMLAGVLIAGSISILTPGATFVAAAIVALIIRQY